MEIAGATDLPHLNADALACGTTDHNAADSPESSLLGCSIAQCPGAALAASPLSGVSSKSAAMLIVHGEDDCVISPAQAVKLYDALRDAGVYTLLRLLPGVGHDDASGAAAIADDIDAFLDVHLMHAGARPRPSHH